MVKSLVITGYGINCERELATACRAAGGEVEFIHAKKLFADQSALNRSQLLLFPGGFSFGDELGSAKVFANRLLPMRAELEKFIARGGCILGICNGFQLLVKLGLLPGEKGQTASLISNATGRFECRWIHHTVIPSHCIFTQGLTSLYLPIRHGEGRFVTENTENLFEKGQVPLQYEENPNGSMDKIAALCDSTGRVMGMMAHPEAALYFKQDPRWTRMKGLPEFASGYALFKNAMNYLRGNS